MASSPPFSALSASIGWQHPATNDCLCVSYCSEQVGVLRFLPTLRIFQPVFGENWKVNSLTTLVLFACFYILNAAWVMTKDSCLFPPFHIPISGSAGALVASRGFVMALLTYTS